MFLAVDLHSHLEASCPLNIINSIRKENNYSKLELENNTIISGLSDFSKIFGQLSRSLYKESDFETATREFLLFQSSNNVIYSEFRIAPYHHIKYGGKSFKNIISFVKNGIRQAFETNGIYGRMIIESARHYGEDHILDVLEWFLEYYDKDFIVGFGIGGIEKNNDLVNYKKFFNTVKNKNIPLTVHAGENGSIDNVLFAINNDSILRIAHPLPLFKINEKLKKIIIENQKLFEVCISSNAYLGYVNNIYQHPVINWYKENISLGFGCDDSTIFNNSFTSEVKLIRKILNINEKELNKIFYNSINFAFCNNNLKEVLLNKFNEVL